MSTAQNIVNLMLEATVKQTLKFYGATDDALKKLRHSSAKLYQLLQKRGVSDQFTEKELCKTAYEKFTQLLNGKSFIRTSLAGIWFFKIQLTPAFRQDLLKAIDMEGTSRRDHFKCISDKYFDEQDYEKMTVDELEWYFEKFNVQNYGWKLSEDIDDSFPAPFSYTTFARQPRKVTSLGIQTEVSNETRVMHKQLAELDEKLAEKEHANVLLQKQVEKLVKNEMDLISSIQLLEKKIAKLSSKKSLKDYVPISQEHLVKKCLQLSGQCESTQELAESILVDENFNENAVKALSMSLRTQINSHLNMEVGSRPWNSKYLMALRSQQKCFSKDSPAAFQKMVNDLLRLRTLNEI